MTSNTNNININNPDDLANGTLIMDGGLSTAVLEWDQLDQLQRVEIAKSLLPSSPTQAINDPRAQMLVAGHPFPNLDPNDLATFCVADEITGAALWTAALLLTPRGRLCLAWAHLRFLQSGARVLESAGYQLSIVNVRAMLVKSSTIQKNTNGVSIHDAVQNMIRDILPENADLDTRASALSSALMTVSIDVMRYATNAFCAQHNCDTGDQCPLISVSIGPYGATLCNGSEYTGVYPSPMDQLDELTNFHYNRILQYRPVLHLIDFLAFETIPNVIEARAVADAMDRFCKELGTSQTPSYLVAFNPKLIDGVAATAKATPEIVNEELLEPIVQELLTKTTFPPFCIGLNCIKPDTNTAQMCDALVQQLAIVNKKWNQTKLFGNTSLFNKVDHSYAPFVSVYCDGGLYWDVTNKRWYGRKPTPEEWAITTFGIVNTENGVGKHPKVGCILGGCCNASFAHVACLAEHKEKLYKQYQQQQQQK